MKVNNQVAEIQVSYSTTGSEKIRVTSCLDAYDIFLASWSLQTIELHEEFKILMLNRANDVLGIYTLSKGGTSGTVVDTKLLFAVSLKCNASSIILCHNHPSGNLTPSEPDKKITDRVKNVAELLEIKMLDHIIITAHNGYYSFSENGLLS